MAMQKKGTPESIDVLRGREAHVLHEHMQRTGHFSVADFDEQQLETLKEDLAKARKEEDSEQKELAKEAKKDESD